MAAIQPQHYQKRQKNKTRLVIVSQTRFILASLIALIILSAILSYFAGLFMSEALVQPEFITKTVASGDTLWSIASQYNDSDEDIREVVYRIRKENNLDNATIYVGQELLIPIKK
jgi:hypothetical protein